MAGKTAIYSALNVVGTIDGLRIVGLWDGDDAIVVEPVADKGALMTGADGESIFSQSANRSARITIRLMHTSATHRTMLQKLAVQEAGRLDGFKLSLFDNRSGEGGATDQAFIEKAPNDQKGVNAANREWVLVCGQWNREIPRSI